jgi:hypothetical protein
MNVEGLKAMEQIGERFVARLRRGRSWDAVWWQERRRRLSQQVAHLKVTLVISSPCMTT